MNKKQQDNKGFALLLALLISSIALSIGLSMLHLTLKQLSLGTTTRGSEIAFQAASAGLECLRFERNEQSEDFTQGDSIDANCFGGSSQTVTPTTDSGVYIYNYPDLEWDPSGDAMCIDMDVYIMDASEDEITYTLPNVGDKTCVDGDVCTFGFARGYNRKCSEIADSIFTVQRELTAEF